MTVGAKRICTICARGGSKGVPGKNIRELLGTPLIAHSIAHARAAAEHGVTFDVIAVSSDSDQILQLAKKHGADEIVKRPAELASDTAAKVPAIRHAVRSIEERRGVRFDTCVDLDATAPLRTGEDVAASVRLLESTDATNVFSVVPARRSPYFNLVELDGATGLVHLSKRLERPVVRRQDAPVCYDMNASIYVWKRDALDSGDTVFLAKTRAYVMDHRSAFDIDDEVDFDVVELLMRKRAAAAAAAGASA